MKLKAHGWLQLHNDNTLGTEKKPNEFQLGVYVKTTVHLHTEDNSPASPKISRKPEGAFSSVISHFKAL